MRLDLGVIGLFAFQAAGGENAAKESLFALHLIHGGQSCGSEALHLGTEFSEPSACAKAAMNHRHCGDSIQWSYSYNKMWGCRCCKPGKASGGDLNVHWAVYSWRTPVYLLHAHKECVKQPVNLGTHFADPSECAAVARSNPQCGHAIQWSDDYNSDWGCRCCAADGTDDGQNHSTWDVYSWKTPVFELHSRAACAGDNTFLGKGFAGPSECASAARVYAGCGHAFMWSTSYNVEWGCRCCKKDAIARHGVQRKDHEFWTMYSWRTPVVLLHGGQQCSVVGAELSSSYTDPGECASVAAITEGCGHAIQWSAPSSSHVDAASSCSCCAPHGVQDGVPNASWSVYAFDVASFDLQTTLSPSSISSATIPSTTATLTTSSFVQKLSVSGQRDSSSPLPESADARVVKVEKNEVQLRLPIVIAAIVASAAILLSACGIMYLYRVSTQKPEPKGRGAAVREAAANVVGRELPPEDELELLNYTRADD